MRASLILSLIAILGACDDPAFLECDGGSIVDADGVPACRESDPTDAGPDANPADAGPTDAGPTDAGPTDAGPVDAGVTDAGDGGSMDAGSDAGPTDAGDPGPGFDAPDCLDDFDCPFDIRTVLEPTAGAPATVNARIDGEDHVIPTACGDITSTDRDVFRLRAPARSFLEVTVTPDASSLFKPVVEVFDTGLSNLIAFEGNNPARLLLLSPAPSPENLLLLVAQEEAYGSLCSGPPPTYRGGANHGYTVTAEVCDTCSIQELGPLGTGLTATASQHQRGAMTVYRFTAPSDATPTVTVSLDGACPSGVTCCPFVVPLEPGGVTPSSVRANYTSTFGRTCSGDTQAVMRTNATGERLFAVYDYESAGAPGYNIDVVVSP